MFVGNKRCGKKKGETRLEREKGALLKMVITDAMEGTNRKRKNTPRGMEAYGTIARRREALGGRERRVIQQEVVFSCLKRASA